MPGKPVSLVKRIQSSTRSGLTLTCRIRKSIADLRLLNGLTLASGVAGRRDDVERAFWSLEPSILEGGEIERGLPIHDPRRHQLPGIGAEAESVAAEARTDEESGRLLHGPEDWHHVGRTLS